ncbi:MAG: hypothetical protein ACJ0FM_04000 [Gammaproteobacteria bacterium]
MVTLPALAMMDRMPDDDRHVLVSVYIQEKTYNYTDVYKLNIFSGKLTLVAKDPVY